MPVIIDNVLAKLEMTRNAKLEMTWAAKLEMTWAMLSDAVVK